LDDWAAGLFTPDIHQDYQLQEDLGMLVSPLQLYLP
jgi:hypothetical protein